jgi:hypothetical protein
MNPEQIKKLAADFEEIKVASSGKRCGVQWTPWMDDWFTSWSPRNGNNNAEGPWAHWVDLALRILNDPMTKLVRPEAHEAVQTLDLRAFYDEADVTLTEQQLIERFADEQAGSEARA